MSSGDILSRLFTLCLLPALVWAMPAVSRAVDAGVPPPGGADLVTWLQAGHYQNWTAEGGLHPAAGPHFGAVRVFVNNALASSLRAGQRAHPPGAAAVKELYGNGQTVRGWAVAVKVRMQGSSSGLWHWFELYDGEVITDSSAARLCVSCHQNGHDMVLTIWK